MARSKRSGYDTKNYQIIRGGSFVLPNVRNFYRPSTLSEAIKLLSSDSERNVVLGGGTQLALTSNPGIDGLVDLTALGLDYRKIEKNMIILGARCRPTDAINFDGLNQAADGILLEAASNYLAQVQRNRASLGGILISAAAWADIATVFLALGCDIVIEGPQGEKIIPIDLFLSQGPAKAAMRSIIKEIRIPTGGCGAYRRVAKTETDISIVDVAVRIDLADGAVSKARISVGGTTSMPIRLDAVENKLIGSRLTPDLIEAAIQQIAIDAVSDFRASGEYRVEVARVLIKRCLLDIAGRSR